VRDLPLGGEIPKVDPEIVILTFRVSRRAIFDLFGRIFEDFGRQIT
jgi:hypothetical protein